MVKRDDKEVKRYLAKRYQSIRGRRIIGSTIWTKQQIIFFAEESFYPFNLYCMQSNYLNQTKLNFSLLLSQLININFLLQIDKLKEIDKKTNLTFVNLK